MNLQKLLEDNRFKWKDATQKEILDRLLFRSQHRNFIHSKEEKVVVVFGKPQVGKTTLILSLMGVDESKHAEISKILRAGIPEGNSSTSTAIIYQRSEDEMFGVSEHGINDLGATAIRKCSQEEFIEYLIETRKKVEGKKKDTEKIIYIYIPQYYFGANAEEYDNINILDVPGYESRNQKESHHVELLLNKYMTVSALNIIIRQINDINDLRDFIAPNGDSLKKRMDKYIVVTTHSYSMESISNYFSKEFSEREKSFEEYLREICDKEFERIFEEGLPIYYPVDVGQSFQKLLNTKLKFEEDREYLIKYRNSIFDEIRAKIQEGKGDSFSTWIKELLSDVKDYEEEKTNEANTTISEFEKQIKQNNNEIEKMKDRVKRAKIFILNQENRIEKLDKQKKSLDFVDIESSVAEGLANIKNDYFTAKYEWKNKDIKNNASDLFAELFSNIIKEYLVINEEVFNKDYSEELDDDEKNLRAELNEKMNHHKILKGLNPSNKKKLDIGTEDIKEILNKWNKKLSEEYSEAYEEKKRKINQRIAKLQDVVKSREKRICQLYKEKSCLISKKKKVIETKKNIRKRVRQDKSLLESFRSIAQDKFSQQRDFIIRQINATKCADEKIAYILLLGLIYKDYEKLVIN